MMNFVQNWLRNRPSSSSKGLRYNRIRASLERLEERAMMAVLSVDINDPTASVPGDNLYAQVQEAVDAASPGDVIKIHSGIYEPFEVTTDNLIIREARPNSNPVIEGGSISVSVQADDVTLKGLTARNARGRIDLRTGRGFSVGGDGNRLIGNVAEGNDVYGFSVGGDDIYMAHNTARENSLGGFILGISDSVFVRNDAIGNTQSGFEITFGSSNSLYTRNFASENTFGFTVSGDSNKLRKNRASDNSWIGFYLTHTENNTLIQNWAISNGDGLANRLIEGGFVVDNSDNNTLLRNYSIGNDGSGYLLVSSNNNTLERNWAVHNTSGVPTSGNGFHILFGGDNNLLKRNRSLKNSGWGYAVDQALDNLSEDNFSFRNGLGDSNFPEV